MMLLIAGEIRPIFWRVIRKDAPTLYGTFTDLKTLRGATKRVMRKYSDWQEIEARFDGAIDGVTSNA